MLAQINQALTFIKSTYNKDSLGITAGVKTIVVYSIAATIFLGLSEAASSYPANTVAQITANVLYAGMFTFMAKAAYQFIAELDKKASNISSKEIVCISVPKTELNALVNTLALQKELPQTQKNLQAALAKLGGSYTPTKR